MGKLDGAIKLLWNRIKIMFYTMHQILFSPKCEECNRRTLMVGINLFQNEDNGTHYYESNFICLDHPLTETITETQNYDGYA